MSDHSRANDAMALFIALHQNDWQGFFDANSLQRGKRYANQRRVLGELSLELDAEWLTLSGDVEGSEREPYHTDVTIGILGRDETLITDCSCPVGVRCKHAVALIQTFLNQMGNGAEVFAERQPHNGASGKTDTQQSLKQRWEKWIKELDQSPASVGEGQRVEATYRLALFLDSRDQVGPTPVLSVLPAWLRPGKQKSRGNGWVAPRSIEVSRSGALVPAPEGGWLPEQEEAIDQLMHGEHEVTWSSTQRMWALVSHSFQARALWALLESETPPLLFHRRQTGTRLERGPTCQLSPSWQADSEGVQRLHPTTVPEDTLSSEAIIARVGRGLCYLDPERGQFGRMEGAPELLDKLYRSPPLPPDISEWLGERLQQAPTLAERLPTPTRIEEQTLKDVTPQLKVTMCVAEGQLGFSHGAPLPRWIQVGAGVVSFDYAGIEVPPEEGDTANGYRDGQRLTIQRDTQAERTLVHGLPSGMVTLEHLEKKSTVPAYLELPPWTLLLPHHGTPPTRATEWPTHLAGPDEWWEMIDTLRQAGCLIEFSEDFPKEPIYLEPEAWYGELEPAGNGWFDLALDIEVEGERVNLLPILRQLLKREDFPLEPREEEADDASWTLELDEHRRLTLPLSRLRGLMTPILDWLGDERDPDASVTLPLTAAEKVAPVAEHERWAGREEVSALAQRLRELPASLPQPPGFVGELRDYQSRGLAWLRFLSELGTGGILADDMGLGKTVQVLAHVLDERARGSLKGPTLVIAPTSLVGNWCTEAARFAPDLQVVALQGGKAQRERQFAEALPDADLVITTYALLIRDLERLGETAFGLLVLDEAQAIKNAASQTARAVRALKAKRAVAMTGTPLENHLGELWAQLDAVAPGALGSQQWFGQCFRTPIEKEGDVALREQLSRRLAPLMLRRTKQQVLGELPDKTETRREITLSGAQRELYESLRLAQHQRVQQAVAERGLAGSGIVMLDALLKLRQVCCDPRLVKLDSAQKVRRSAKLDQLRELLPPLIEEGRRILVFSQFTEMLGLIGQALEKDGIAYTTLTGDTPGKTRTQRVARFQQGEVPVFLISLKAGGTGLNLTAADTVIHYDPWWNPAVEAQATGRAHRMGQQNPVFVYKLMCAGTVEERIHDLQSRKAALAASILEGGAERQSDGPLFDEEDLALLFAPVA
ncbi:MAG: DNA/RNA helicase, superfamily II, SNF2 family [Halomonas sp. 54_146]|nr:MULTISPECIES: DEAD/DEAH box helicase [unclassified Halomonas]KUJ86446.1 MAG: DNA/RNA helicase, superfamily II, SNF2 family [Halomonas sp. 54_146]HAA45033.1 helicase SNF2 [Halomonas sp.]